MADNEGFEDLNNTESDSLEDSVEDSDSSDSDTDIIEESAEPEVVDDSANQIDALNAAIAILQTEASLKEAEIERWKSINLELLMSMPTQDDSDSVADDSADGEEDDPEPYKDESGAARLFKTKE